MHTDDGGDDSIMMEEPELTAERKEELMGRLRMIGRHTMRAAVLLATAKAPGDADDAMHLMERFADDDTLDLFSPEDRGFVDNVKKQLPFADLLVKGDAILRALQVKDGKAVPEFLLCDYGDLLQVDGTCADAPGFQE